MQSVPSTGTVQSGYSGTIWHSLRRNRCSYSSYPARPTSVTKTTLRIPYILGVQRHEFDNIIIHKKSAADSVYDDKDDLSRRRKSRPSWRRRWPTQRSAVTKVDSCSGSLAQVEYATTTPPTPPPLCTLSIMLLHIHGRGARDVILYSKRLQHSCALVLRFLIIAGPAKYLFSWRRLTMQREHAAAS